MKQCAWIISNGASLKWIPPSSSLVSPCKEGQKYFKESYCSDRSTLNCNFFSRLFISKNHLIFTNINNNYYFKT